MRTPLLETQNLSKTFPIERGIFKTGGFIRAVENVSFKVEEKEIVALVGESGSGKSTLGRMVQGLIHPTEGSIRFQGKDANSFKVRERAHWVQTIFQDPYASLNPKRKVGSILREALRSNLHNQTDRDREIQSLLESIGLSRDSENYYPHQFSGGQRQRIGIARALAMKPKLIVADEPVSSLDLSIQAQILNLLIDLNERLGISYLFISHDLSVVKYIADRVLILKEGKIVEQGEVDLIFQNPKELYTQNLISAIPVL